MLSGAKITGTPSFRIAPSSTVPGSQAVTEFVLTVTAPAKPVKQVIHRESATFKGAKQTRRDARCEDIAWMNDCGGGADEAANRLGMTRDALWKFCDRHGMRDVFLAMSDRDRKRDNQWTGAA
jgi:hypothetical protein